MATTDGLEVQKPHEPREGRITELHRNPEDY